MELLHLLINHQVELVCFKLTSGSVNDRHRSLNNFLVNLMAGIVACWLQPKKPTVKGLKKNQPLLKTVKSIG